MKLYQHQQQAVALCRESNLALFHACGTGKTCTALYIIKHWKMKGAGPALVVCPLSIIEAAWIEDCKQFTPELSIVSLWSKKPKERKEKLAEEHDIYVANYATFKYLYKDIVKKDFSVLIVDESSKMKNPRSQITKALLSFAGIGPKKSRKYYPRQKPIPKRYVLSGTPAPNDETEYWAQVKFITGRGNEIFNDNFYAFRGRYCFSIDLGGTGQKIWRFRKEMKNEFGSNLALIAHTVRKKDAVDLPDQVHEIRDVILTQHEQKVYNKMEKEKVLQFADEAVLSPSALTDIMKLRQITSGFCYGNEGIHQIGKSKLKELKSLLDEIGDEQVIIWANFKQEITDILEILPNADALWSGTTNREAVIKDFQAGKTQYLVANPASAAHGLTFTNCNYAVYFSLNYSYELAEQSRDRIHRIGQDKKCTYFYLLAKGTVDEVVYKTLNKKSDLSKGLLNYLRKGLPPRARSA